MFDCSMFILVFACFSTVVRSAGSNVCCFLGEVTLLKQDFEAHVLCLQIYVTSIFFFFCNFCGICKIIVM